MRTFSVWLSVAAILSSQAHAQDVTEQTSSSPAEAVSAPAESESMLRIPANETDLSSQKAGFPAVELQTEPETLPLPTLDDFLDDNSAFAPEISSSGRYLAVLRYSDDVQMLLTIDLDDPTAKPGVMKMNPFYVRWTEWATDDRLLLSVRGFVDSGKRGKLLTWQEIKDGDFRGFPIPFSRLLAMNRDGSDSVELLSEDKKFSRNLNNTNVVDFLRDDPDHILMAARLGGDLDLFKVNIMNGDYERIAIGTGNTYAWYVDSEGEPALRLNTNRRGNRILIYAREDRENGDIKWRKVRSIRLNRDNTERDTATEFRPLKSGPTPTTYYVAARPEGENTTGIYLYDFEKDEYIEAIKQDPEVDIETAIFDMENSELLATAYVKDRLVVDFKDPLLQAHMQGLNEFFGQKTNVIPIQSSRNGKRLLIQTVGPLDPGSFHTYDIDDAHSNVVGMNSIALIGKQFSDTEIIRFTARDGLALTGYLTRPASAKPGDKPPLIMMPHGGPEARDSLSFDRDAQILASKGYQVFQPNFRGSSGFGKEFADRGRRQWGKAMQTDLKDGLQSLIDTGLVDSEKTCILGGSYGGYAALAALTFTPDLYRCGIAVAAPSELVALMKWEKRESGNDSETYEYLLEMIGDPKTDRDDLWSVSPAKHAANITRPLLLIHGEDDGIVPVEQAEIMEAALKEANIPYEIMIQEDTGHSHFGEGEQRRYYEKVLSFLATHLPTDRNFEVMEIATTELNPSP